jgi:membrane-associated phospholipid phosphatase
VAIGQRHLHGREGGAGIDVTTVRRTRPALVGEALIVLTLVFAYDRIRGFAHARADLAIANGRRILSLESWLHVKIESVMNDFLSQHHGSELAVSWYYQLMFLSATLLVLLWIYWRHPTDYRPARNALIGINTVGLLVFWVLPVAPPRLIPGAGFVDSAVVTDVADKATTVSPDLYAAMPSLHVAWATWVALQVLFISRNRIARVLGVAHAVITCLAVMATANHYLLDVVAGYALAAVVVWSCRPRTPTDVRCPHVPAARSGGRSADRDSAGIGLARQWSYRRVGEDRCLCDRPGRPAELRAGLARLGSAGRRWRAGVPRDPVARPGLRAGHADGQT